MEKRKALGKGLQALIPDTGPAAVISIKGPAQSVPAGESIVYLNVSEVKPGRYQPRTSFNQEKQQELISSIKEKGVVQPILVRRKGSEYEIIAGERRLRAVKAIGVEKIPAIIRQVSDIDAMEIALIENIQREELNPIEEARAYQRLCQEFGFTQEKIAQSVGKDRTTVTNMLRLLNLPEKIQNFILAGLLSMGHARTLLSVVEQKRQLRLCEKIIEKGLSVRATEQLVKPHAAQRRSSQARQADPHTQAAQEELQRVLGTKVVIQHGKKRGRLIIEYFSASDLDRIIDIIAKKTR